MKLTQLYVFLISVVLLQSVVSILLLTVVAVLRFSVLNHGKLVKGVSYRIH
jgi:hypothetical protein